MAISVKIADTTYRCVDNYSIRQQGSGVSSTTLNVLLEANDVPLVLQTAQVLIDGVAFFLGLIQNVGTPEYSTAYETQIFSLSVSSLECLLNFRNVKHNFYLSSAPTYSDVVQWIFDNIIAEENITLGAISLTEKTYTSSLKIVNQKASSVLDDICNKVGNAAWWISADRKFYFRVSTDFTSVVAPTHISELKLTENIGTLRTSEIIVGASAKITATESNADLIADIAARTGGSGKIEVVESDSTIHNTTKADTEATSRLARNAESEKTITCLCHDLVKSALYTCWPLTLTIGGVSITGDFVVVERTISHRLDSEFNIRVTLKNANYFAHYGYALHQAAEVAKAATATLNQAASDNAFTPDKKIRARADWATVAAEVAGYDAQATASGVLTAKAAYDAAFQALADYLNGGSTWTSGLPLWLSADEMSVTEEIDGTTYEATWNAYYSARTALQLAINSVDSSIHLNSLSTPGNYDGQTGEYLGVRYVWSENSLYPAAGLYPASGLYPSHSGQWIMEDAAYAQSVALQAIATDLQAQLDRQLTIYVQNSDPRNNAPSPWGGVGTDESHTGDLWYDMTVGAQVTKRWSGTAWLVVEDAVLTAALARIASLETAADGTVTVYGERPEVGPYQVGDFWYDLTVPTNPHLYVATVPRLEGVTGSISDWALTSISNPTWSSRTTAENSGLLRVGDELYENGARYRCSFAGVRLFPSENLYPASGLYPSGYAWERISPISWGVLAIEPLVGMIAFDTYFNSTDSKGYYYTGTAWSASTAALATQDYADAIADDLQDQVDGKIAAFWQTTAPTSGMETDDLWFDTDNGNRAYRYNGTGWVDAQDSDIAAGLLAAATAQATADGKTAVFSTLALAQASAQIGDLFLDASLLYRATVAGASITLANSTRLTAKIYPDVADATALAALTGMIRGDTVYMTSTNQWYKYTTAWETDGAPQLGTGDISTYTPRYLGALTALSGTYHPGDYFLCKAAFSSFTKGLIYKYSGSSWAEDTDSGHKMIAMDDLLDIAEAATDAAVIFGKKIVALELVVRELFAQAATIQSLTVADLSVVDITAGDCKINVKSLSLTDDDLVSEAPQFNWVVQAPGTIRVGCSLLARIGIRTFGYDSTTTFYLYRTRSGTETLLGSYARGNWGGTNVGSFTADITVEVGDIISLKVLQSNLLATASIGLDTYSPLALVV